MPREQLYGFTLEHTIFIWTKQPSSHTHVGRKVVILDNIGHEGPGGYSTEVNDLVAGTLAWRDSQ